MGAKVGFWGLLFCLAVPLAAEAPYIMHVLYPGEPSARMQSFLAGEFHSRILKELNIDFRMEYAPWPSYHDRIDLRIAAEEPLDWFWGGTFETGVYASRKQVQPLDDLLKTWGPDLLKAIPPGNFLPNKIAGKVFSIPSQRSMTAEKFYSVLARTDLLEAVGVRSLKTFQDLLDASAKIKAKFPGIVPFASVPWLALLREAAPGWYTYDHGITLVNEAEPEARVYGFFEQKQIVLKVNAMAHTLVAKGYVSPEALTDPNSDVTRFQSGRCAFWSGAITRPLEQLDAVRRNEPKAQLREFLLNPEAPRYIVQSSNEALFVPTSNTHPEKAIQFFNWILKNRDNYEFTLFGVKGQDFRVDPQGRMVRLNSDELFYEWMFRNDLYLRMPGEVSAEFLKDYADWDRLAQYSKVYGFTFDQTPVVAEASQISALAPRYNPVVWGMVDASQGRIFEDVQLSLRKAGIEKYVAEFNRQLAAFHAKKP